MFVLLLLVIVGYPVLWAISDKENETAMQVIFNSVKKRCPNGTINVLMTDDSLSGANACSQIYPGVTHLLCRWHVDKYVTNFGKRYS